MFMSRILRGVSIIWGSTVHWGTKGTEQGMLYSEGNFEVSVCPE